MTSIKTAALGITAFNSSRLSDPSLFWSMAWKRPSTSLARFCARLAAGPVSTASLSGFYRAGNHSEIIDDGAYLPATHGASGESFMQAWGKVSAHDASLGKSECSRAWGIVSAHEPSLEMKSSAGKNRRKLPTFLYPTIRRLLYISTECSSAIHVLREAQYDAEVVSVAMVLGSILGAGNTFFLLR